MPLIANFGMSKIGVEANNFNSSQVCFTPSCMTCILRGEPVSPFIHLDHPKWYYFLAYYLYFCRLSIDGQADQRLVCSKF